MPRDNRQKRPFPEFKIRELKSKYLTRGLSMPLLKQFHKQMMKNK